MGGGVIFMIHCKNMAYDHSFSRLLVHSGTVVSIIMIIMVIMITSIALFVTIIV